MAFKTYSGKDVLPHALVVDNSVMMRWLFNDGSASDQQYAQTVLQHIQSQKPSVIVPYLWVYEAAFVVHYYVKQGKVSHENSLKHLDALFDVCDVIRGEETKKTL